MATDTQPIECCGLEQPGSNFCRLCGKQLRGGPLVDLLNHARMILRRQQRLLERATSQTPAKPCKRHQAKIEQYRQAAAVWQARCDALAAVIDRDRSL